MTEGQRVTTIVALQDRVDIVTGLMNRARLATARPGADIDIWAGSACFWALQLRHTENALTAIEAPR